MKPLDPRLLRYSAAARGYLVVTVGLGLAATGLILLQASLLAATAGRTTLLITHDLDGLDQVDEIVVLEAGRVAERGTHAQLIRSGGAYHRLWQASREEES